MKLKSTLLSLLAISITGNIALAFFYYSSSKSQQKEIAELAQIHSTFEPSLLVMPQPPIASTNDTLSLFVMPYYSMVDDKIASAMTTFLPHQKVEIEIGPVKGSRFFKYSTDSLGVLEDSSGYYTIHLRGLLSGLEGQPVEARDKIMIEKGEVQGNYKWHYPW